MTKHIFLCKKCKLLTVVQCSECGNSEDMQKIEMELKHTYLGYDEQYKEVCNYIGRKIGKLLLSLIEDC